MFLSQTSYLRHILDEVDYLLRHVATISFEAFLVDETQKRAAVRSFEIIGEATKNLSDDLRLRHPEVAWRRMAGMRDVLTHKYFNVDYMVVWKTSCDDLPTLRTQIEQVIEAEVAHE